MNTKELKYITDLRGEVLHHFIWIEKTIELIIVRFITGEGYLQGNFNHHLFLNFHIFTHPKFEASIKVDSLRVIFQLLNTKLYSEITHNKKHNVFHLLTKLLQARNIFAHKVIGFQDNNYNIVKAKGKVKGLQHEKLLNGTINIQTNYVFSGTLKADIFPLEEKNNLIKQFELVDQYFNLFLENDDKLNRGKKTRNYNPKAQQIMDTILKDDCVKKNVGAYLLSTNND